MRIKSTEQRSKLKEDMSFYNDPSHISDGFLTRYCHSDNVYTLG